MKLHPVFLLVSVLGCGACASRDVVHEEQVVSSVDEWFIPDSGGEPPSGDSLRDLLDLMTERLSRGEHEAALNAWREQERMVVRATGTPHLASLVEACNRRKEEAEILVAFQALPFDPESDEYEFIVGGRTVLIKRAIRFESRSESAYPEVFSPSDCTDCSTCAVIPAIH